MTEATLKFNKLYCPELVNRITQGSELNLSEDELNKVINLVSLAGTIKMETVTVLMLKLEQEERGLLTKVLEFDSLQENLTHAIHRHKIVQVGRGGEL